MLSSLMLLVLGFVLLVVGGEVLIRGASKLALLFRLPPLVIGLTVVAYGTSAPELAVSAMAGLSGNPDIAISNVVGSNIFNITFILAVCSLIAPLVVNLQLIKFDIPILILLSIVTWLFCLDAKLSRFEGALFLLMSVFYTVWLIRAGKKESVEKLGVGESDQSKAQLGAIVLNLGLIILGIALLVYGSRWLVQAANELALKFGVPESVVGLTIVAAGTSLPELFASLMATVRGQTDLAIGNVIGSSIFNLIFILGTSSLTAPNGLSVATSLLKLDMLVMLIAAIICYPLLVTGKKLVWWEGLILLTGYAGYISTLL